MAHRDTAEVIKRFNDSFLERDAASSSTSSPMTASWRARNRHPTAFATRATTAGLRS
jgi:hypothetical protein